MLCLPILLNLTALQWRLHAVAPSHDAAPHTWPYGPSNNVARDFACLPHQACGSLYTPSGSCSVCTGWAIPIGG